MSEASKYWIEGFLIGNQPSPPTDEDGMSDFESKAYEHWEDEMELFSKQDFGPMMIGFAINVIQNY